MSAVSHNGDASRWLVVVNPHAGGGRALRRLRGRRLEVAGRTQGVEVPAGVEQMERALHNAYARGMRRFALVGGDGTLCSALNALSEERLRDVEIALIPAGTGNSFARDLGIFVPEDGLRSLEEGCTRRVDLLRVAHGAGSLLAANLVSLGFSAKVGELCNRRYKRLGSAGYAVSVFACLLGHRATAFALSVGPAEVGQASVGQADTTETEVSLLSVCNSRFTGGGMKMAPEAQCDDGLFDIVGVASMGGLELARAFPKVYRGEHIALAKVWTRKAAQLGFRDAAEQPVLIDGEIVQLCPQRVECLPGAVSMRALPPRGLAA